VWSLADVGLEKVVGEQQQEREADAVGNVPSVDLASAAVVGVEVDVVEWNRARHVDDELQQLAAGDEAIPRGPVAHGRQRVVQVHRHMDGGVVEAGDPAHVDLRIDCHPAHGDDDGMVVDVQEDELALAQHQEVRVEQLVVLGQVERNAPARHADVDVVFEATAVRGEPTVCQDHAHRLVAAAGRQHERHDGKNEVVQRQQLRQLDLVAVLHPRLQAVDRREIERHHDGNRPERCEWWELIGGPFSKDEAVLVCWKSHDGRAQRAQRDRHEREEKRRRKERSRMKRQRTTPQDEQQGWKENQTQAQGWQHASNDRGMSNLFFGYLFRLLYLIPFLSHQPPTPLHTLTLALALVALLCFAMASEAEQLAREMQELEQQISQQNLELTQGLSLFQPTSNTTTCSNTSSTSSLSSSIAPSQPSPSPSPSTTTTTPTPATLPASIVSDTPTYTPLSDATTATAAPSSLLEHADASPRESSLDIQQRRLHKEHQVDQQFLELQARLAQRAAERLDVDRIRVQYQKQLEEQRAISIKAKHKAIQLERETLQLRKRLNDSIEHSVSLQTESTRQLQQHPALVKLLFELQTERDQLQAERAKWQHEQKQYSDDRLAWDNERAREQQARVELEKVNQRLLDQIFEVWIVHFYFFCPYH
jgi:hypothetical protein